MKKAALLLFPLLLFILLAGVLIPTSGSDRRSVIDAVKNGKMDTDDQLMNIYFEYGEGVNDFTTYYEPILKEIRNDGVYISSKWLILPFYLNDIIPTDESIAEIKEILLDEICEYDDEEICRKTCVDNIEYAQRLKQSTIFSEGLKDIDTDTLASLLGMNGYDPKEKAIGMIDYPANYYSEAYISPFNPFAQAGWTGQCTWYAYARANEVNHLQLKDLPLSDARQWYQDALLAGFEVGQIPAKNSIAVWGGKMQHVAYVEAYDGETITISEGNYGANGTMIKYTKLEYAIRFIAINSGDIDWLINRQNNGGGYFLGFIYLTSSDE